MKKPNKHVIKAVAGLTVLGTLSTLGHSCQESVFSGQEAMSEEGLSAITIDLDKDDLEYISFLNRLGQDIINNPLIAKEFAENPQAFVQKYGYNETVDLDENFLRLILSFGDDDINSAIRVGDISLTMMLMSEKGFLDGNSYNKIVISEEQKNKILAQLGIKEADFDKYASCTALAICAFALYLAVGVVQAVGVVSAGAAVVHVAVYEMAYFWSEGAVQKQDPTKFIDDYSPLRIWAFKGNIENTYVAVDIHLEEQVRALIDAIETFDSKAFNGGLDKEEVIQLAKLNILKNYF